MRTDLWSEQEKQTLINHWGSSKKNIILDLLPNRELTAIQKKAQRLKLKGDMGLAGRIYSYNHNFFSNLNAESCYWAGFIAADGCVEKQDDAISIKLARKDRVILESFRTHVEYNGIIKDYIIKDKRNGKRHKASRLEFYGAREWKCDLLKYYNITQKKSLTLQPPDIIDIKHIYPFIIGYFDGDGCSFWSDKVYNFGFVGTYQMMKWIKKYIDKLVPTIKKDVNITYANDYPRLVYRGSRGLEIRCKLLEFETPFKLNRKWHNEE